MGAHPTYTCAPYLLEDKPQRDEVIGWSESNAVIYANSILGAKTQKHPDYLDLFIAMTGRAPKAGVYLTENRIPKIEISVHLPTDFDDSIWPMLGWLIGDLSPNKIPLVTGLEMTSPSDDDLKSALRSIWYDICRSNASYQWAYTRKSIFYSFKFEKFQYHQTAFGKTLEQI